MNIEDYTLDELKDFAEEVDIEELYEIFLEQFNIVKNRHEKFITNGNKTAEKDVRRALGRIKVMVAAYRRKSSEVCKSYLNPSKNY